MWIARVSCCALALLYAVSGHAQLVLTEGTNLRVDAHASQGIVFDLLGGIWQLDDGASTARPLVETTGAARHPQWSPAGTQILFEQTATNSIALLDITTGKTRPLTGGRNPRWHPSGERVLYIDTDQRGQTQLFEIDIATDAIRQLTHTDTSVMGGVWSHDGEYLAYITQARNAFQLWWRDARGERLLLDSSERISSPSIRPDNSLVTFVRHGERLEMEMAILSQPVLVRTLLREPDLFDAPVVWRSREQLLYTANGKLRKRHFNSWSSRNIPFRASLTPNTEEQASYSLPPPVNVGEAWVLRVGGVFDGRRARLGPAADIVIRGNSIVALEAQHSRDGLQVIDLGRSIAIPGLIDACGRTPQSAADQRRLLGHGVMTLVPIGSLDGPTGRQPAPRILEPACDGAIAAKRFAKQQLARMSPAGIEYQDSRLDGRQRQSMLLSGLAQAPAGGSQSPFAAFADSPIAGQLVLASAPNRWPLETAALAEINALSGGKRSIYEALLAATGNASNYLGLSGQLGVLAAGARADIVLLPADPDSKPEVLQTPIALVFDGQLIGDTAKLRE